MDFIYQKEGTSSSFAPAAGGESLCFIPSRHRDSISKQSRFWFLVFIYQKEGTSSSFAFAQSRGDNWHAQAGVLGGSKNLKTAENCFRRRSMGRTLEQVPMGLTAAERVLLLRAAEKRSAWSRPQYSTYDLWLPVASFSVLCWHETIRSC